MKKLKGILIHVLIIGSIIVIAFVYWRYYGDGSYKPILQEYAKYYKEHDYNIVNLYPEEKREYMYDIYESRWDPERHFGIGEEIISVELIEVKEISDWDWKDNYVQESDFGEFNMQATEKYEVIFQVKGVRTYKEGKYLEDLSELEGTEFVKEISETIARINGKWYII